MSEADMGQPACGRVLTRYGMLATHLVEELGCGTAFSSVEFFQSLTDALLDVGEGGEVEEALVGGGILEDGFRFAVDGEDDGALGGFELLEEIGGVVAKGGEGLGVLGGVDHGWSPPGESLPVRLGIG